MYTLGCDGNESNDRHDPMALLRKLPFVGRTAEYETLVAKLNDARNRRSSVVLFAGEPGSGKTRLTEEFCELLRRNAACDADRGMSLLREALAFAAPSGMGKVRDDSERLLSTARALQFTDCAPLRR